MFKGKVRIYKNVNWKEHHFKKNFHNEKDFNDFIERSPDLKDFRDWEKITWSENLLWINNFFDEAYELGNQNFLKEMEEDIKRLFDKSRKLLGKRKI